MNREWQDMGKKALAGICCSLQVCRFSAEDGGQPAGGPNNNISKGTYLNALGAGSGPPTRTTHKTQQN
ncbi:hypothetical protein Ddc_04091 [Ditylenchus destructor]|nr:hypothetical protein Ddc_04091 [Ditylenchus destructor]